ncbi:MAG: hypothetical protein IKM23_04650 [Bacteroidales bacterium]|nr:hypothetical protein [Bacteroidales bacterium]
MHKYVWTFITVILICFASCRKQVEFSDNDLLKLSFSSDTVTFDTVFTTIGSSTRQLMIYNNNEDNLKISSIRLEGGNMSQFAINVDGESGYNFSDIEIFAKDSLYVFVRVTINPDNQNNPFIVEDRLIFETNNNKQVINLIAYGQNANYIIADQQINGFPKFKIIADSLQEVRWTSEKPYVIYGYALINSYGTLVIEEGTQVHFHNGGGLWAYSEGQLRVEGTSENPVVFQGDRLESYYDDEPGQWDRIWLMEAREGYGHTINHAIIRNGFIGIQAQTFLKNNMAPLTIHNTIIDNHTGMGIYSNLYNLKATNFVVSNCGNYAIALTGGGEYIFEQGTIANYWNKGTRTTPSLFFNNIYQSPVDGYGYAYNFYFEMNNCIMSGNREDEFDTDFYPGPDTTYYFNNSLLKTKRRNNESFINFAECVFNRDPKFINNEYDFHLDSISPAIGIGNPYFSTGLLQYDLDGVDRGNHPDAGAYQYVPNVED